MRYLFLFVFFFGSCAVGPDFSSPAINIPKRVGCDTLPRDLTVDPPTTKWWSRFNDPMLDTLVALAVEQNKDVKIAQKSVEQAKLRYRNSRSALAPIFGITASGGANYEHSTKIAQSYTVTPTMSWELDLFGGGRRTSEGAKASSIATIHQYNGALLTVIASVAESYFSLLEYNVLLDISKKSYMTRFRSYELMQKKFEYGAISKVALDQAYTLLLSAQISVDSYRNAITEASTALSVLTGQNPKCFNVSSSQLFSIVIPSLPPTIMPSSIVENRPDIATAYYNVWASSAAIGVAVSKRFPTISLQADGGILYDIVRGTTTSMPFVWGGTLSIAESLLNFGINKRNVQIARLSNEVEILTYEKTILTAFSEVENAISQIISFRSQEKRYRELVNATSSINEMNNQLYNRGSVDYLSVLDSERSLFDAQTQYATMLTQKLTAYVALYKAIGGGW